MASKTDPHHAYLLSFWRQDAAKPWRVIVQRVGAEQQLQFASVSEAVTFVLDQLEQEELAEPGQGQDSGPSNVSAGDA